MVKSQALCEYLVAFADEEKYLDKPVNLMTTVNFRSRPMSFLLIETAARQSSRAAGFPQIGWGSSRVNNGFWWE